MKKTLPYLAAASLVVLAACGDDTEDAMSAVCDAQSSVFESLGDLESLDPASATKDDLDDGLDDLGDSIDDLREARGDMAEQDVDNVTTAFDDLRNTLSGLDDVPLSELPSEVAISVIEAVAEFQVAYETAYANSSC